MRPSKEGIYAWGGIAEQNTIIPRSRDVNHFKKEARIIACSGEMKKDRAHRTWAFNDGMMSLVH